MDIRFYTDFYINGKGYADGIVGKALQNVNQERGRKERMENMAKKRNCRRTTDENIIHEKAVKMRKMTDEQLVHYVEDRVEKARSEGFNQGKQRMDTTPKMDVAAIIDEIGGIRGIGAAKLADIRAVLESRLEVLHG